ncbi:hypothetical protein IV203_009052 [Nitzschia inconspicua]|uniref:Uncharacterized protein n=1 Tax=Nitzschia inconspicua TaxID=303405 RepID=A0A9K3L0Q6_9STRA|nr:hypothetical protein IV203_009052 [Nitzschia inconspicua]
MTRSSEVPLKSRSRSRTPRKNRSNSFEEHHKDRAAKNEHDSLTRRRRSRSRSRARDGDRGSWCSEVSSPPTDKAGIHAEDSKNQRSRSKSTTRDPTRRSRSKARGNIGRKTRQGSTGVLIDEAAAQEKRVDQRVQPRERSRSRARRMHRKNIKRGDPGSTKNEAVHPISDDLSTEMYNVESKKFDPVRSTKIMSKESKEPQLKESYTETSSDLNICSKEGLVHIGSPLKPPPDPSGVLCYNESIHFTKDDLLVVQTEEELLGKSRHSEHRRSNKASGASGAKAGSDKNEHNTSLSHSTHSKSNQMLPTQGTTLHSLARQKPPETPKRKQRTASSPAIIPSRRERRKSLSAAKNEKPPMPSQPKGPDSRAGVKMTNQENFICDGTTEGDGKIDQSRIRIRPKKATTTPTKSNSCPSNRNREKTTETLCETSGCEDNAANNTRSSEKSEKALFLDKEGKGENDQHGRGHEIEIALQPASVDDIASPLPQNPTTNDFEARNLNITFSSSTDFDASFADTIASNTVSVSDIFGHLNCSSTTIVTRDLAVTLGPYLPEDHPLASTYRNYESPQNIVDTSHIEQSSSKAGLLNALLDSNLRTTLVAEPSLCSTSIKQSKTLDSLLDFETAFTAFSEPSICAHKTDPKTTLFALLDAKPTKLTPSSTELARRSTGNLDEVLPSSFPPSLHSLFDAEPRSFPSSLPEPSICPSPNEYPSHSSGRPAVISSEFLSSVIPEGEYLSPSRPISRRIFSNRAVVPGSDPGNLFKKTKNDFDSLEGIESSKKNEFALDPSVEFGNFDYIPNDSALPQASRQLRDLGELLPSSEHVKVHRVSGGNSSNPEFSGNPGYLQLDLETLGRESSNEVRKSTDRLGSSRHKSLRKSLASFRKRPGHESLLGDCD